MPGMRLGYSLIKEWIKPSLDGKKEPFPSLKEYRIFFLCHFSVYCGSCQGRNCIISSSVMDLALSLVIYCYKQWVLSCSLLQKGWNKEVSFIADVQDKWDTSIVSDRTHIVGYLECIHVKKNNRNGLIGASYLFSDAVNDLRVWQTVTDLLLEGARCHREFRIDNWLNKSLKCVNICSENALIM